MVLFDGIMFAVAKSGEKPLPLLPPWVPFGLDVQPPSFFVQGDLCILSGAAKIVTMERADFKRQIATLPSGCRPDTFLYFHVPRGRTADRFRVLVGLTCSISSRSHTSVFHR